MTGPIRTRAPLQALILSLAAAAACAGPPPAPNRLWTIADLTDESHKTGSCSNPGGLPCNYFVRQRDGRDFLFFKLAFAESQPMAYMTTDFWDNYDRIWLQPMYFLVTAWNVEAPSQNRLKGVDGAVGPIFSVGPESAFYSPFWSVFYVEVPAETPPDKYTSARQLFDDHLVMHPGANRFASIGPMSILPTAEDIKSLYEQPQDAQMDGNAVVHVNDYLAPLSKPTMDEQEPLDRVIKSARGFPSAWVDGRSVQYVDFGPDNFVANAAAEVQDVPLFVFTKRDRSGQTVPLGAPNVGGVAPLFSGAAARVSDDNRPQFGGLWRLVLVNVPPAAAMLDRMAATGNVNADGEIPPLLKDKLLRVALDRTCFDDLRSSQGATDTCVWLDSQKRLEDNLGSPAFTRTNLQPACPFVMWKSAAVPWR